MCSRNNFSSLDKSWTKNSSLNPSNQIPYKEMREGYNKKFMQEYIAMNGPYDEIFSTPESRQCGNYFNNQNRDLYKVHGVTIGLSPYVTLDEQKESYCCSGNHRPRYSIYTEPNKQHEPTYSVMIPTEMGTYRASSEVETYCPNPNNYYESDNEWEVQKPYQL